MATIIEPRKGPNTESLKWNPTQIPPSKPFVNISTTPEGSLSTYKDVNFIKTRSLIYSPFHSSSRYVDFEIGYPKNAKWLESINNKWNEYSSFFIGGFFEAIYTENNKTYVQIDAKMIDYDIRSRHPNTSSKAITSPTRPLLNAFALKRNESASPTTPKLDVASKKNESTSLTISKSNLISRTESMDCDDISNEKIVEITDNDDKAAQSTRKQKNRQLSDLCDSEDEPINNEQVGKGGRGGGRGIRGKGGNMDSVQEQIDCDSDSNEKIVDDDGASRSTRSKKRQLSDLCDSEDEPIDNKQARKGGRGKRGGRGGRGKGGKGKKN
jgi:hypothetical protein